MALDRVPICSKITLSEDPDITGMIPIISRRKSGIFVITGNEYRVLPCASIFWVEVEEVPDRATV